jgi:hypothetical protein
LDVCCFLWPLIHLSGFLFGFLKGEENQVREHFSNSSKKKKNVEQNLFLPYPLPKVKESTQVLCIHLKKAHVIFSFLLNVWMKEIHCKERIKKHKKLWIGQEQKCKTLNPCNCFIET